MPTMPVIQDGATSFGDGAFYSVEGCCWVIRIIQRDPKG